MYQRLLDIIVELSKKKEKKTKQPIKGLEQALKNSFYNQVEYEKLGGYREFYQAVIKAEEDGWIKPIKTSRINNLFPQLHEYYWIIGTKEKERTTWSDGIILMLKDELDISYYLSSPYFQTKENLKKLLAIYRFMKTKERHNWLNREERSLMLFGDEKFLSSSIGKSLIERLKITYHDLKIDHKQQTFDYVKTDEFYKKSVINVLIIEGKATYQTFGTILTMDLCKWPIGESPDLLIFGGGDRIHSSFSYIDSFISGKKSIIWYGGDIDPAGLNIFYILVTRFPQYDIRLAENIYEWMLLQKVTYPIRTRQIISESTKLHFQTNYPSLYKRMDILFKENLRIPQEVLNFDTIILEAESE